jgi:hypothetical protein
VRGDPGPGPPFGDLLARLADVAALERPQPAVDRSLVVERQAAAKVRAIDEDDCETAEGRVIGGEQAMDAAADDEQIVALECEVLKVSRHGFA